ncbi:MAG: hypothetical protein COS95_04575 [Ignavibacteriales bacterium CG07_land_8_20_14_0_80_59_12]|nr:MAG: hypothetical protein COS95_04575 [Ignavibacteriales bacterium CG07_land_8_20_14_0_80_59_12]
MKFMRIYSPAVWVVILLILVPVLALGGRWEWKRPLPQGNTLNGIVFVDDTTAWVLGDHGTLRRLEALPGGGLRALDPVDLGTSNPLYGIDCCRLNIDYGWIVGAAGTIYRTTDRGAHWDAPASNPVRDDPRYELESVAATGPLTAWVVGKDGFVMKTTDGGHSWRTVSLGTNVWLWKVYFFDSLHGWIAGNAGEIYRTGDGGSTWMKTRQATSSDVRDVQFATPLTGFAAGGDGTILRTTDEGDTWTALNTGQNSKMLKALLVYDEATVVTVGEEGTVLRSTNAGATWSVVPSPITRDLNAIAPRDPLRSWVVGQYGAMMMTSDRGLTWSPQSSKELPDLYALRFRTVADGWAAGSGGRVVHTTNFGTTWRDMTVSPYNLNALEIIDSLNVVVAGDYGRVFRTSDAGVTWSQVALGTTTASIWGLVRSGVRSLWGVGGSGTVIRSTDGGATWVRQSTTSGDILFGVSFVADSLNGWAVGFGGTILHTTNGGTSWQKQSSPTRNTLFGVKFTDLNLGWAVGENGLCLRTQNGGATWEAASTPNNSSSLFGIAMVPSSRPGSVRGYAVGQYGTLWQTGDTDGRVWVMDGLGTSNTFRAMWLVDEDAWVCGDGGTILRGSGIVAVREDVPRVPPRYAALAQNYPNPFNPTTTISFATSRPGYVSLRVYDVLGREAATLCDAYFTAGDHVVRFDGHDLPAGIYLYVLRGDDFVMTRKMNLVR